MSRLEPTAAHRNGLAWTNIWVSAIQFNLGELALHADDGAQARPLNEEGLRLIQLNGGAWDVAMAHYYLGEALFYSHEFQDAATHFEALLAARDKINDHMLMTQLLTTGEEL